MSADDAAAHVRLLSRIQHALVGASLDELATVALLLERVRAGRQRYGPLELAHDQRDLVVEALEEAVDAAFYLAAALVRVARGLRGEALGPDVTLSADRGRWPSY